MFHGGILMDISVLQKARHSYEPKLPHVLTLPLNRVGVRRGDSSESLGDQRDLKLLFKHTYGRPIVEFVEGESPAEKRKYNVGVVLSGGQAPGGHNVIAGLVDALKECDGESQLFGFLGGPSGVINNEYINLTPGFVDQYRNTGGFDMIGSGRTKIETEEQFEKTLDTCIKNNLDALVIIGGDDSNTNAALLAEYFIDKGTSISVIGVPKTIDGDLKGGLVETSFGFDTATKTYAELIGNIERDADSAKKYWHFIKLMGRSASHICLECALRTHPNIAIISEEVASEQMTLQEIVRDIVNVVVRRSENGDDFGVVLVPEGLIEYIPEMKMLIAELNDLLANGEAYFSTLNTFEDQSEWVNQNLSRDASYAFSSLPYNIQRQLLMDRDPHGNVQVSRIETEKLLIEMVTDRLNELKATGKYKGKFGTQSHFLGYEGRSGFPSNFDADYCYALGYNAFLLAANGLTGYISAVGNLSKPATEWTAGGAPLTMMMNMEQRRGMKIPVIKKALVELDGKPFRAFASARDTWSVKTSYLYPGAIQYYGPDEICNAPPESLVLEQNS